MNIDDRLRQAERDQAEPESDGAALLRERLLAGELTEERVRAAARCGHGAARRLFPDEPKARPEEGALSAYQRLEGLGLLTKEEKQLFGVDCALLVKPLLQDPDFFPRGLVERAYVARLRLALGEKGAGAEWGSVRRAMRRLIDGGRAISGIYYATRALAAHGARECCFFCILAVEESVHFARIARELRIAGALEIAEGLDREFIVSAGQQVRGAQLRRLGLYLLGMARIERFPRSAEDGAELLRSLVFLSGAPPETLRFNGPIVGDVTLRRSEPLELEIPPAPKRPSSGALS